MHDLQTRTKHLNWLLVRHRSWLQLSNILFDNKAETCINPTPEPNVHNAYKSLSSPSSITSQSSCALRNQIEQNLSLLNHHFATYNHIQSSPSKSYRPIAMSGTSGPCRLLALPGEIRNQIWEDILEPGDIHPNMTATKAREARTRLPTASECWLGLTGDISYDDYKNGSTIFHFSMIIWHLAKNVIICFLMLLILSLVTLWIYYLLVFEEEVMLWEPSRLTL